MRLNCLIVSLRLWCQTRFRSGFGVRRSQGLGGMVPHFFHVRDRGKELVIEDYIPRRRKIGPLSDGDSFLMFDGQHRVRVYTLTATATSDTLFGARRDALHRRDSNIAP